MPRGSPRWPDPVAKLRYRDWPCLGVAKLARKAGVPLPPGIRKVRTGDFVPRAPLRSCEARGPPQPLCSRYSVITRTRRGGSHLLGSWLGRINTLTCVSPGVAGISVAEQMRGQQAGPGWGWGCSVAQPRLPDGEAAGGSPPGLEVDRGVRVTLSRWDRSSGCCPAPVSTSGEHTEMSHLPRNTERG